MLPDRYQRFLTDISALVPQGRLFTDPLRTLAYGTDASFYRLIPKIVVRADTEAEVAAILKAADHADTPVTFRAAGTSLSGQAVSDSVLIVAGGSWNRYEIIDNGGGIRLQPGVIGGHANRYLAPYGRKIGPDPASINSAMIGGIAANNASGMCCGTAQNSYRTVTGMRILFQDGTLLDTADPASRDEFRYARKDLLDAVDALGKEVRANTALAERIRRKYKIKNTTGFSLNALVDFEDPFDILLHLMIGSEGTLGFISEITYQTVVEHPCKASALMIFPQIENAATAAAILRDQPVAAVELMDRASLRSVENKAGMPDYLKVLSPQTAALLVETRAFAAEELQGQSPHGDRLPEAGPLRATLHLHRPGRGVHRPVEHPQGAFPGGGRRARNRHHGDHRGRGLPHRPPRQSHAAPSRYHAALPLRRGHHLRPRPGGQPAFLLHPGFRTPPKRSNATGGSCTRSATWWSTPTTVRSRPSTARAATWRPTSNWSGAARPTPSCSASRRSSTPRTSSTPASSSTRTPGPTSKT